MDDEIKRFEFTENELREAAEFYGEGLASRALPFVPPEGRADWFALMKVDPVAALEKVREYGWHFIIFD